MTEGSLPARWTKGWAAEPARPVLWSAATGWVNAAELEQRSRSIAGRLAGAGLGPGDRLVLSAATSVELAATHVGALRLGLVVVPLNPELRQREVAQVIADARPGAAVVDAPGPARWIVDAAGGPITLVFSALQLQESEAPPLDRAGPGDPALLCYTSGTTGEPKGALLGHGNLLAGVEALRLAWRWTPEDRLVHALPLFHVHGLVVGLHGTLAAGASAVLLPRFDVDAVLDAAAAHRATLLFGVPTTYARLAASPRAAELGRLRLCVSGSAPLPAELFARLERTTGQRVLERYGMTETLMNTSNPLDGERRPGSVGVPLPGVEVRLGDDGEILLRGPNVFAGYWRRPEATAAAFTDGWFRSGDVGSLDPDGYLRIVGRLTELIISGGENVYPREVEDVLREHPGVADVAVVGTPDDLWGEAVTAVVVPRGDPTHRTHLTPDEAALRAFCADRLAPHKRPRIVRFVDDLPRNALGKVLRGELT